jgi:hypothetical protein
MHLLHFATARYAMNIQQGPPPGIQDRSEDTITDAVIARFMHVVVISGLVAAAAFSGAIFLFVPEQTARVTADRSSPAW